MTGVGKDEAELAVVQERARISRELHDIVAHAVTDMLRQADGAQRILHKNPDRVEASLSQIADLGRAAMNELRRMRALQPSAETGEPAQLPGLDDLGELLEDLRRGGHDVTFTQEGEPRRVDASVALAAYRTVQEALGTATPAGAAAQVRLVWTDELLVEVTGAALPSDLGLLRLRERLGVVGGHLDAGLRDGGGFRVSAVLPALSPD